MLAACRLAGLSALQTYYARVRVGAQCGTNACVRRPRSVARRREIARAVEKAIEVTPQGWADCGAGCAARPLRWCKNEGNGRLRRVGIDGLAPSASHTT
jgi:hypothetical protein